MSDDKPSDPDKKTVVGSAQKRPGEYSVSRTSSRPNERTVVATPLAVVPAPTAKPSTPTMITPANAGQTAAKHEAVTQPSTIANGTPAPQPPTAQTTPVKPAWEVPSSPGSDPATGVHPVSS